MFRGAFSCVGVALDATGSSTTMTAHRFKERGALGLPISLKERGTQLHHFVIHASLVVGGEA